MTVEADEITAVLAFNPRTFVYDPNPPQFEVDVSEALPYTIPNLFQRAQRLSSTFDRIHIYAPSRETSHVAYDSTYGYPTQIIENSCGAFLTFVEECVMRIDVVRFIPGTQ
jgi:hypothetical protein